MPNTADDLVFYSSENGDQWVLVGGAVGTTVRHLPNLSSGGNLRDTPLEEFLPREQSTPQGQALGKLLERYGHN